MAKDSGHAGRAALREHRNDAYDTPPVAIDALTKIEKLPHRIWEPACGIGNIVNVLRANGHHVIATDLNDRGCADSISGIDFLLPMISPDNAPFECDAIITNPPYMLAEKFIALALERAPLVMMLLRLAFLESEKRTAILENGMLARVHVFAKRLPMMHRANYTGKRASSGVAFAWFIWDRANLGPATIHRVHIPPTPAETEMIMMGPDERVRAAVKALNLPRDDGPLFHSLTTQTVLQTEGIHDESQHQRNESTGS